jgi:hypothetical protein
MDVAKPSNVATEFDAHTQPGRNARCDDSMQSGGDIVCSATHTEQSHHNIIIIKPRRTFEVELIESVFKTNLRQ